MTEPAWQRLFLVRHGEVSTCSSGLLYGHTDVELSETGREQSRWVADILSNTPVAAIYSSDLKRAINTAEAIAKRHCIEVTKVEDLREINMGSWEGRAIVEVSMEYPELIDCLYKNPIEFAYPNGESFAAFEKRVLTALSTIRSRHSNDSFAIVAHGGVCRMILGQALGMAPQNWLRISQDYGCINVIDWYDDRPIVRKVNYSAAVL